MSSKEQESPQVEEDGPEDGSHGPSTVGSTSYLDEVDTDRWQN